MAVGAEQVVIGSASATHAIAVRGVDDLTVRTAAGDDVISVTGSAKKRISSDYIVWNLSVTSEQGSANAAARELAGWTTRIRSFLTGAGVTEAS